MSTKSQKQGNSKTLTMPPRDAASANAASLDHTNELIRKQWPRLSEEEVNAYRTDRQRFCDAVRREYHVPQEEVDVQLDLIKRQSLYAA